MQKKVLHDVQVVRILCLMKNAPTKRAPKYVTVDESYVMGPPYVHTAAMREQALLAE